MAKSSQESAIERIYNVPLRKGYMRSPRWKRTKKAVSTLRVFLSKHMKSDTIKIGRRLNEALWKDGIKNPPHHIKLKAVKDNESIVKAELFGFDYEEKKAEESKQSKKKEKDKEKEKMKDSKAKDSKAKNSPKKIPDNTTDDSSSADIKQEPETKKDISKKE